MISSPWALLIGAIAASATMICVWLVSLRIHNASDVGVAWAFGIAGCSRGDDDRRYQGEASVFVPLAPQRKREPVAS